MRALLPPVLTVGLGCIAASCTMKSQEAPPLMGPSEFAQSLTIGASPDVLPQDGISQSVISINARDYAGQPVRSLSLRVDIEVEGVRQDFGSLSARNVVTGADGRATLVYRAPAAPPAGVDTRTDVDIVVLPIGTDFNNSWARRAAIRLVPPGVILPPDGMQPAFTFAPEAPTDNQNVLFDASSSTSTPSNPIVGYSWNFGDGGRASGVTAVHAYAQAGTYVVMLTVNDAFGRQASRSRSISVGAGTSPTAEFVFSPTNPRINQAVNFNGSASRAAAGRQIVQYIWDFGDGTIISTAGPTASHSYELPRTYTVTLRVRDNTGAEGARSLPVQVAPAS